MAPRRGSGGSSFSSSDGDLSLWIADTTLFGTNFHDSYRLAIVVIQAIFLFAIIVVLISSWSFRKRSQSSQALFKWYRYGLAMVTTLVFFIFSFINIILEEKQAVVVRVYYLISTIIENSIYPAEIFLLVTVFATITQLNKRIAPLNFLTKAPFAWIYGVFCAVLFLLFLAIYALRIQHTVKATLDGELTYLSLGISYYDSDLKKIYLNMTKITIAYVVLYMVASLGALVLAGWTLMRSFKEQDHKQKLMGIFLVALVAFPLFLRSTIEVGIVASYSLDFYIHETKSGSVAETFFYYFCTVVVFAGIVAIGFHLAKDVPEQEQLMYGPQPGMIMSPHGIQQGGSAYFANGQQGYVQGWNKQPLVTQQHAPIYYGQNNAQNGGEQTHNYPTGGDPRATVQPVSPVQSVSPVTGGYGAPHGMNGYGQAPEMTSAR